MGKNDLADDVQLLSREGDGYGYDILSFDVNGVEKYIEVKGSITNSNNFNFYMSSREFGVAKKCKKQYELVLVKSALTEGIEIVKRVVSPTTADVIQFVPTVYCASLKES